MKEKLVLGDNISTLKLVDIIYTKPSQLTAA